MVSPLLSLIEDQTARLRSLGVHARALTAAVGVAEQNEILRLVHPGANAAEKRFSAARPGETQAKPSRIVANSAAEPRVIVGVDDVSPVRHAGEGDQVETSRV